MSISQKNIELFEKYRNGDLSELELKEFNARVSYDSEFKNEFEKYQTIEEGIKAHHRSELKSKLQELDNQLDQNQKSKTIRLLIWITSVAAIFLLGFFTLNQFHSKNDIQIAQEFWTHEEGLPVKMSTKGKYDDAMNAFKLEQFDEATRLLQQINSDTSDYFLGVIAFQQNKFQKSATYFDKIKNNSRYYNEAQFRLALVLLMNEKSVQAKTMLQNQSTINSEFTELAKQILKKLDK